MPRAAGSVKIVPDQTAAAPESPSAPMRAHGDARPARRLGKLLARGLSALLDPTIVLSFDRTGFALHAMAFDDGDLHVDLSGRRCLVTGANSGLGFAAACGLAGLGAEVVLLCRSRARGESAVAHIRATTGNQRVALEVVDVASLAAVRAVAPRLAERGVDVLVHNAGTIPERRIETAEGLELALATHVVGPHLLTTLLRPALERSSDARVVWVSSGGMYTRRLAIDDAQWRERPYDGVLAYAETKRAQVVLAELWAERLRDTQVVVNAMHPGWADTPAVQTSLPRFHRITRPILRSAAQGADTIVWLAAAAPARGFRGRFFLDRAPRRTHLLPFTRETEAERRRLWELCEKWAARTSAAEAA